jgi:hypothetical protein
MATTRRGDVKAVKMGIGLLLGDKTSKARQEQDKTKSRQDKTRQETPPKPMRNAGEMPAHHSRSERSNLDKTRQDKTRQDKTSHFSPHF